MYFLYTPASLPCSPPCLHLFFTIPPPPNPAPPTPPFGPSAILGIRRAYAGYRWRCWIGRVILGLHACCYNSCCSIRPCCRILRSTLWEVPTHHLPPPLPTSPATHYYDNARLTILDTYFSATGSPLPAAARLLPFTITYQPPASTAVILKPFHLSTKLNYTTTTQQLLPVWRLCDSRCRRRFCCIPDGSALLFPPHFKIQTLFDWTIAHARNAGPAPFRR